MGIYIMLGKYSQEGLRTANTARNEEAVALIEEHGGRVQAAYAVLGEVDLVMITDFPEPASVIKASLGLTKLLGVSFSTAPAMSLGEFGTLLE